MSLYVEVRRAEDGVVITNATFPAKNFSNYGNGVYFVVCNVGDTIICSASGRNAAWINTDAYYKFFQWLTKQAPPHTSSHSQGYT